VVINAKKSAKSHEEKQGLETLLTEIKNLKKDQKNIKERKRLRRGKEDRDPERKKRSDDPLMIEYRNNLKVIANKLTAHSKKYPKQGPKGVHPSKLVVDKIDNQQFLLDPGVDIRNTLYPNSWNSAEEEFILGKINQMKDKDDEDKWICPGFRREPHKVDIADKNIDHIVSAAKHWWIEGGKNTDQNSREKWYRKTSNLRSLCSSCNSKKGSIDEEEERRYFARPIVGPKFSGPGEERG
jgi:hypothetical protein